MNRFWILGLAAALSLTPAFAAAPKPAVEIRLKAATELVPVLEYGGNLFGQGEVAKQFGGIIKTFVDNEKGFFGLDLKKPVGAYVSIGEKIEDSSFALMLPVVDETTSLDALKNNLGLELKKGDGGIYSADVPGVPGTVYVAFGEGYAYLTIRSDASVQKGNRISPKDFFPAKAESVLGVKLFPDRVPADVRKYLVGQVEMQLQEHAKASNATGAPKIIQEFLIETGSDILKTILTEGEKFALDFDIDPKGDDVKLNLNLSGKPGSTLEKTLASFADRPSTPASIPAGANSIGKLALNFNLPPETKKRFAKFIDAAFKAGIDEAKDNDKIAMKMVADAISPTLRGGDAEFGLVLSEAGKPGKIGFATALKMIEGKEVEKLVKAFATFLPKDKGTFEADVEKLGSRNLHKLTIAEGTETPLGADKLWILASDDLIAVTADAKADSLKAIGEAKSEKAPMLFAELSFARIAPLTGTDADTAKKVIADIFEGGKYAGKDTLTIVGHGGKDLKLSIGIKGKAIAFLAAINKAKGE